MNQSPDQPITKSTRHQTAVAIVLLLCLGVVGFWEVASNLQRPASPFDLNAEDFENFTLASPEWSVEKIPVRTSALEPNIAAFRLQRRRAASGERLDDSVQPSVDGSPVVVRLVHGYNMRDCMRIKGYTVDLIEDIGSRAVDHGRRTTDHREQKPEARGQLALRRSESEVGRPVVGDQSSVSEGQDALGRVQVWKLTSSIGDESIWVAGMLRAGDFSGTRLLVTDMAFPRIGVPDDPNWMPEGMSLASLKHPVRNTKWLLRAKWNNARCDLLTFLKLRRPAWASDDDLTLVSAYAGPPLHDGDAEAAKELTAAAYAFAHKELHSWRVGQMTEE